MSGEGYKIETAELLNRAADGDDGAFSELVEMYNEKLVKIAGIFVGDGAEDMVQEAWLKIYRYREKLREVQNLDNWLYFVVRRRCLDALRSGEKNNAVSLEENAEYIDSLAADDDVFEVFNKRLGAEHIARALSELDDALKTPLLMYYFKGFSLQEIAKTLDLPYTTVKWRLHAGRQKLKKYLGEFMYE